MQVLLEHSGPSKRLLLLAGKRDTGRNPTLNKQDDQLDNPDWRNTSIGRIPIRRTWVFQRGNLHQNCRHRISVLDFPSFVLQSHSLVEKQMMLRCKFGDVLRLEDDLCNYCPMLPVVLVKDRTGLVFHCSPMIALERFL